jgi:hypothetical protein
MNTALTRPELPSNRSFGWTFAAVFALVALLAYPWLIGVAALIALVTVTRAHWLAPFNRAWMRLGALLHHVVSPLMLGLIYFAVFTPVGIVMRLAGRDALLRRWDRAAPSYWVRRDPPGPADGSFRDMF